MKQYVVDQLNKDDIGKLKPYLDDHLHRPNLEGIYWMRLEGDLLSDLQKEHRDCGPFYVAVELAGDRLICELLVRAESRIRCGCIQYADSMQRQWAIGVIDAILDKLRISA